MAKSKRLKKDELLMWQGRVELAQRHQDKHGDAPLASGRRRWKTNVKALAGDFDSASDLGPEAIDVNMVYATQKTSLPPLWLNDVHVSCRPTRKTLRLKSGTVDNIRRTENAEVEINHWLGELKVREKVVRPCVIDAENFNHGYAYVGYTTEKADLEDSDGDSVEPNPLVRMRQPFVRRLSPRNVLLPPGKWDIEECEWIAIKWPKKLKDVQSRYGMAATRDLEPTKHLDDDPVSVTGSLREFLETHDAKLVELIQIWDKRSSQVITLAHGHDRELLVEDWTIEMEGFPVVDLSFVDIPDDYYGTPSTSYYLAQNKELNAARTAQRKRFNRTKALGLVSGDVSEDTKKAYNDARDGDLVTMPDVGPDDDIRRKILFHQNLQPDQGVTLYGLEIKDDIRNLTGLSGNQRGGGDPNVDTATEAAEIQGGVQVRASDKADRVRSFWLSISSKLYMILTQFPDAKRDRLVLGADGQITKTLSYTLAEIKGEFAMEMDLSGMLSDNPANRLIQAQANYNLMRADPMVNPESLILDVFKAQNKPNPERYLLFLRNPDEELQMMLQGLPVEAHERDEHMEHEERHEQQAEMLERALGQVASDSPTGQKIRFALGLLLAHQNGHAKIVQSIASADGRQAGQPIAENSLRAQTAQVSGSETAAELRGQPLTG